MAQEYKLKDCAKLELGDSDKAEYELEGVEGGKVLLVKSHGKVHAMSSTCTHFGAPLKTGVVSDGRITCPWHGACFNVASGDVEDAPALDALAKFEIVEKSDGVYIKGEEKVIKASRRAQNIACKPTSQDEKVVIIGGYGCEFLCYPHVC